MKKGEENGRKMLRREERKDEEANLHGGYNGRSTTSKGSRIGNFLTTKASILPKHPAHAQCALIARKQRKQRKFLYQ